jgi:uncharacterized protein involved in type VI secretion and phage assembly
MKPEAPFAVPAAWRFGAHLAVVASVRDDLGLGRIQVRLYSADPEGEALVMARVCAPFAGPDSGAYFIPDVGDEVLVAFLGGDHRQPVVIGGLWNGSQAPPETLDGERVDKWTITGRRGTRVAILEESPGQETIALETPAGVSATLTDAGGGRIRLETSGHSVTLDQSGVSVETPAKVEIKASEVSVTAASVKVNAMTTTFSGVVNCASLVASSVASATYSPGAGNVW